jgi:adenylate cyclase
VAAPLRVFAPATGSVNTLRRALSGLFLGVGGAAVVWLLALPGWIEPLELKTYDWRIRQAVSDPPAVHPDIVLVEINDTSIRDLAPVLGRWPWPRMAMASVISFLNRGPAKVIAVDVSFLEPQRNLSFRLGDDGEEITGEQSDRALAAAIRARSNVILLADAVYRGVQNEEELNRPAEWRGVPYPLGPAIEEVPLIVPPFQILTDSAAALGHNLLVLDPDGPARRMPPFVRVGARYMPSLGVAAGLMALGTPPEQVVLDGREIRIGSRRMPLVATRVEDGQERARAHDQLSVLINYRAPARVNGRSPYRSFEARHLLFSEEQVQNGETPLIDPRELKDKIVFIGLTASGLLDVFQTPFGKQTMPGIQLHASMAESVMTGRFVRPSGPALEALAMISLAVLVGLFSTLLPFTAALWGALLTGAGWSAYAVHAFRNGLWLPIAEPVLAMSLAVFGGTAYRYFVEDREKRKLRRLFSRYVSKDVCTQLLEHPELAELGGGRRTMTVLFSDIRGFTSVTEQGDPQELVAQLNEYFSKMVEVVFRHHGTVDKFVGDMVMALFGAPLEDGDHADHAVAAAVSMVAELAALNQKWAAAGRATLDIGVGINTGEMIAGNIGSTAIMSYTVIGDNVNLGARLESLNKEYRTRIIISDATREQLKGTYALRPLGDVVVKGRTRAVTVFEVVVPSPLPALHEEPQR